MQQILPWLTPALGQLATETAAGRLPHALLITGQSGVGKGRFAHALAEGLLCERVSELGVACGHCKACGFLARGTHPDLLLLEPEEPGKPIKIDSVRGLCNDLTLTSHSGGYKIAIIEPADAMNTAAANALLKTLEEPTDNTLLILVTTRPGRLLPTIRSRCRRLLLGTPDRKTAIDWLTGNGLTEHKAELTFDQSKGAPLAALSIAQANEDELRLEVFKTFAAICIGKLDPLAAASKWNDQSLTKIFGWMRDWITDMIRLTFSENPPGLSHRDLRDSLEGLGRRISLTRLYKQLDDIQEAQRLLETQANPQLLLEGQLISWMNAGKSL